MQHYEQLATHYRQTAMIATIATIATITTTTTTREEETNKHTTNKTRFTYPQTKQLKGSEKTAPNHNCKPPIK